MLVNKIVLDFESENNIKSKTLRFINNKILPNYKWSYIVWLSEFN